MYENRFGRFTAVDPLLASGKSANPQTFNRYVYVGNNPVIITDPTGLFGDYYNRQGGYIGNDRIDDGKVYFGDDNGKREERDGINWIILDNIEETSYLGLSRLYTPRSSVQPLMYGFGEGLDNIGTATGRGLANIGIGTWNFLSNPLGPVGAAGRVPNPFYVTPYPYDNLQQARIGTGIEIGIPAGLGVAGGTVFGGGSRLSILPQAEPGTATINYFRTSQGPHFSVRTQVGITSLESDQIIINNQRMTTIRETAGLQEPTNSLTVSLPDAGAAMQKQYSLFGKNTGIYNSARNSCVTHVCDILNAGGLNAPNTTRQGVSFFRALGMTGN